jgi:hypothetical protein
MQPFCRSDLAGTKVVTEIVNWGTCFPARERPLGFLCLPTFGALPSASALGSPGSCQPDAAVGMVFGVGCHQVDECFMLSHLRRKNDFLACSHNVSHKMSSTVGHVADVGSTSIQPLFLAGALTLLGLPLLGSSFSRQTGQAHEHLNR